MNEICLLADAFYPLVDGVVNAVDNHARVIMKSGRSVCVAAPDCPGVEDTALPYPVFRYHSMDLRRSIGYTAGIPVSERLQTRLKGQDIALLHSHCPMASTFLGRSLREALNVPLVMTYHTRYDLDFANTLRGKMLQDSAVYLMMSNIAACDEVWTVSRGAGESLRSLGYRGDYRVVENGVDIPRGRLTAEETERRTGAAGLPRGIPVFLFVGRLMWYKGIRLILDALKGLASQQYDFRMVFVGKGNDESAIRTYADELGLTDKCVFTGPVYDREDLRAWYCRADLFLFPSTFDTYGLVVREAAACSLSSVLIRGSCAAEGTEHGRNCLQADENAVSLAVCLASVICDREKIKKLGENASRDLYISWDDAVGHIMDLYQNVTDAYRAGRYPRRTHLSDELFKTVSDLTEAYRVISDQTSRIWSVFDRRGK